VPEASALLVEIAAENLKKCKLPDVDQISTELIQSGGRKMLTGIHTLIDPIFKKDALLQQQKDSNTAPIYKESGQPDPSN
jgi:hypothetical protein